MVRQAAQGGGTVKSYISQMQKKSTRSAKKPGLVLGIPDDTNGLCVPGYVNLEDSPEIIAGVLKIAQLIGSLTIHLMNNTEQGDERIVNELSRMIDITPAPGLTRQKFIEFVVKTLLLRGRGNAVVLPHTREGYLQRLEPIAADRVSFLPVGFSDYRVQIDGREFQPADVLHFTFNPDNTYAWKGRGINASIRDVANGLKQAQATKTGFLANEYKPSMIVKVDAMDENFADPENREKILQNYVETTGAGKPWVVPAEQFDIQTVKPLTLADLAIADDVTIDKKTVASILGVPAFVLGVGDYHQAEWNNFVQNTIGPLCVGIQQEMTNKLILSPNWFLRFNILSLMDWDIKTITSVFTALQDRGTVSGNEVRDRLGMGPKEGLDELVRLENYIPADMAGNQKKLTQQEE